MQTEAEFHDTRWQSTDDVRARVAKYYSVLAEPSSLYRAEVLARCAQRRLLELGCGRGDGALRWARRGAIVTAVDLSAEGIARAEANAAQHGVDVEWRVMNAEALEFHDGSFDLVVGTGILHHLDLHRAYAEVARVLRAGGHAYFAEPLGHNPLINVYRRLTPRMRTPTEHPLRIRDIRLAERYFECVEVNYFGLLVLLAAPLRRSKAFGALLRALSAVDRVLMSGVPSVRKYAWLAVLHFGAPRRFPVV